MRRLGSWSGLVGSAVLAAALPAPAAPADPADRIQLRPVRYELDLLVDFKEETVSGAARILLRNDSSSPAAQASLLLYRLLTVRGVTNGAGSPVPFTQQIVAFEDEARRQVNRVVVPLAPPLPPGGEIVLRVEYGGYLAGYVETGSLYIKDRVDESFTILREDAEAYPTVRVPSARVNRAAGLPDFDYLARITVPNTHVVASGGSLVERTERDGRATYVYRSVKPSWRMDFAIARYGVLERDGFKVYHFPEDVRSAERILEAARAVRSSYTKRFGPLPEIPSFAIIEIPDGWGSQADVTSILQSAAAFKNPERVGELYHEVSHLWNVRSTDPSFCRWNEGLA
ncbi:MAG TPA: hypothetical protein VL084_15335, partial [Thermoanaerobaculia bacterium]|nr:hypothetical protein [Thermoanaerobaculia bacterium]